MLLMLAHAGMRDHQAPAQQDRLSSCKNPLGVKQAWGYADTPDHPAPALEDHLATGMAKAAEEQTPVAEMASLCFDLCFDLETTI